MKISDLYLGSYSERLSHIMKCYFLPFHVVLVYLLFENRIKVYVYLMPFKLISYNKLSKVPVERGLPKVTEANTYI